MEMKLSQTALVMFAVGMFTAIPAPFASADTLGSADAYAVLATASVTNAGTGVGGATVITGDMGSGGAIGSCTGFIEAPVPCTAGPGMVTGAVNVAAAASGALTDFGTAYTDLANTTSIVGETAGTFTCLGAGSCLNNIAPGVYSSSLSSTLLGGAVVLNGGSNPDPVWIFQFAAGLTAASDSSIAVIGTGAASAGIYFEVGSQATLGSDSMLQGNFLAGSEVAFLPGAQITCGRAFAYTTSPGLVSFAGEDTSTTLENEVDSGPCGAGTSGSSNGNNNGVIVGGGPGGVGGTVGTGGSTTVSTPEPGTLGLLSVGLALILLGYRRKHFAAKGGMTAAA
jgi:hypothetical protein